MNRNLFLQLLEKPDSVSEQAGSELKKFVEDFPYCQTGQLLLVKHLHSQGSVHYPDRLKLAAVYAADRKVLYHLIHSEVVQKEIIPEEKPISQPTAFIETEPEIKPASQIIEEKKPVEETASPLDIIQKRLQEISASPPAPLQRKGELAPPETNLVSHQEETITPEPKIILQKEEEKPSEIPHEKKEADLKTGKHSFTEWLKTVKKEPAREVKTEEKKTALPSATDEIINRFIETEPRIVPSKAEFYNPVKAARQSLEERDDIISETLANLFAEQGNLKRAIEMYKKLKLLSPEKSSLFAARIEKLTQQLNTEK